MSLSKIMVTSLLLSALCACQGTIEDQKFKPVAGDQGPGDEGTLDLGIRGDMSGAERDQGVTRDMSAQAGDVGVRDADHTEDFAGGEDLGTRDMTARDAGVEDMTREEDMPAMPGSQGCRGGSGLPEGENTFMLGGRSRRYILRLPQSYDASRPWPVVLALHGNGGTPSYWDTQGGERDIRAVLQDEAILVVASAIENKWRDYDADSSTWPGRIEEELEYFDRILNDVKSELCVDEDRLFAMGFSGGGSFSGVLGCRRRDIRAIAVGGSVIYFDQMDCVNTPAAWITIGAGEQATGRTAYLEFFRDRAGCAATTTPTSPSPCVAYEMCGAGTPVHYCEHAGAHVWPALGTQAMWDFFSQF